MKYLITSLKFAITMVMSLLILVLLPYFQIRFYRFATPLPFSGNKWQNPYQVLDSTNWKLCNFHTHANVYHGLTNGVGAPGDFVERYKDLGYDFMAMSNYMAMCDTGLTGVMRDACYEHGYGIPKNHQIVINASEVKYTDFFIFQTRSTEQCMIDILKKDSGAVVALAHPKFRDSYALEDMPFLSGYDLLEVKSHYYWALKHWDAALSAGHPVFLIANDDAHDYNGLSEVAVHATLVNIAKPDLSHIASALKKGHAMAFSPHTPEKTNWAYKKKMIASREKLLFCKVSDNRLTIRWDRPVKEMRFIGQDGALRMTCSMLSQTSYALRSDDTYIRIEADFPSGNSFLLNPICRTGGPKPAAPVLILWQSIAFRLLLAGIILLLLFAIKAIWLGRK